MCEDLYNSIRAAFPTPATNNNDNDKKEDADDKTKEAAGSTPLEKEREKDGAKTPEGGANVLEIAVENENHDIFMQKRAASLIGRDRLLTHLQRWMEGNTHLTHTLRNSHTQELTHSHTHTRRHSHTNPRTHSDTHTLTHAGPVPLPLVLTGAPGGGKSAVVTGLIRKAMGASTFIIAHFVGVFVCVCACVCFLRAHVHTQSVHNHTATQRTLISIKASIKTKPTPK